MLYEVVNLTSGDTWSLKVQEPRLGEYLCLDGDYFKIRFIVKFPEGKKGECLDPIVYVSSVQADLIRDAEKMREDLLE